MPSRCSTTLSSEDELKIEKASVMEFYFYTCILGYTFQIGMFIVHITKPFRPLTPSVKSAGQLTADKLC